MTISIFNLIEIPHLNYYKEIGDDNTLLTSLDYQLKLSIIYFLDLILMILLYGFKTVFLKKTYALRLEVLYLVA